MKVLLINKFKRGFGGVDTVVGQHIKSLEKNGIEFKVFKYSSDDFLKNGLFTQIRDIGLSIVGKFLVSELHSLILTFQPDIIHVHNIFPLLFKSIAKELRSTKSKIVFHIHNFYPFCLNSYLYTKGNICTSCIENNSWKYGIIKKCYNHSAIMSTLMALGRVKPREFKILFRADKYIAASGFVKDIYTKYGFDSEKIEILNNPTFQIPSEKIYENNYVLYIGALLEQKGLFTLIEAARQLPEIRFCIVGDGKDRERIRKYADGLDNITFYGSLFGKDKYHLYNNCRFIVIPSKCWETFGMVALEANSCGKYVLTTGCGGLSEIIDNCKSGELYDEKNLQDLISKIRKLWITLDQNKVAEDCKNNAEKYSFNRYCENIDAFYNKLLKKM